MALHRTAIMSCAALIALALAAALLLRGGGGDGPFHVIETAATPTVEVAGLPAPPRLGCAGGASRPRPACGDDPGPAVAGSA